MIIPSKRGSISGWMEEQLKTTLVERRCRNNYEYIHVIGKGGFGKVYKVKEKKTNQLFAMKEMSKAVYR
jgi:serine/threonine protein kinase